MSHLDLFAFANQGKYASQNDDATHCFCHRFCASHVFIGAQENYASQYGCATPIDSASQWGDAIHDCFASPHPSLQPKNRR